MKKSNRQLDMCLKIIDFKSQAWIWHFLIYGSWDNAMEYRERMTNNQDWPSRNTWPPKRSHKGKEKSSQIGRSTEDKEGRLK